MQCSRSLDKKGAKNVYAYVVHAVLSGDAVQKIQKSKIKQFVVTNSIDNYKKLKVLRLKL
jgi:Phosphoribosylpyrophosphate synthetase